MRIDLKGKKTIFTIGLFAVLAIASLFVNIAIPEWVFAVLAALGLGFLRSAVKHLSGNSGWKTYAAVVVTIGIGAIQAFGIVIPPEILTTIYTVLGSLGVIGVRDALKEIPKD